LGLLRLARLTDVAECPDARLADHLFSLAGGVRWMARGRYAPDHRPDRPL